MIGAIIEASSFELSRLWERWHEELSWDEGTRRQAMQQIGEIDGRPVNITLQEATIDGVKVILWEAVSEVVDYSFAEEFFDSNYSGWPRGDADNFKSTLFQAKFKNKPTFTGVDLGKPGSGVTIVTQIAMFEGSAYLIVPDRVRIVEYPDGKVMECLSKDERTWVPILDWETDEHGNLPISMIKNVSTNKPGSKGEAEE